MKRSITLTLGNGSCVSSCVLLHFFLLCSSSSTARLKKYKTRPMKSCCLGRPRRLSIEIEKKKRDKRKVKKRSAAPLEENKEEGEISLWNRNCAATDIAIERLHFSSSDSSSSSSEDCKLHSMSSSSFSSYYSFQRV
jgi:hypothetical protein